MAKQMAFTAETGVVHPESYWRPVHLIMDIAQRSSRVVFHGYANKDARLADKAPVAQKIYTAVGETYESYFSKTALDGADPLAMSYALATATLDTGDKSFFDGAQDV